MLKHRLTEETIENNKQEIIKLLRSTEREGIETLLSELERSGFYTHMPLGSSHHEWVGGLAQHSLDTYKAALQRVRMRHIQGVPADGLIIVCILHDLCKAYGLYPEIHKEFPDEHGMRSLRKINKMGFKLTDDEAKAIRNHMHHDPHSNTSLHAIVHEADGINARMR